MVRLARFAAAALALSAAAPALASSAPDLIEKDCQSVFAGGCAYSGVINGQADAKSFEDQYNLFNDGFASTGGLNQNITLKYLTKLDLGQLETGGNVLSNKVFKDGNELIGGTLTNPGFTFDFFAVKAGNTSVLFAVDPAGSSFDFSTARLKNKGVSHIVFFGTAVPEPATWAMMIGGFGLIGAAARRRNIRVAFA